MLTDLPTFTPRRPPTVVLSRVPPDEGPKLQPKFDELIGELTARGVVFQTLDSIYDLQADDDGASFLRSIRGDLICLGWHYPRALKWILARQNLEVNGVARKLHCVDLREGSAASLAQQTADILAGAASAVVEPPVRKDPPPKPTLSPKERGAIAEKELAPPLNADLSPRWYPVIDYDTCTNCMDCMDFCLFGVYGVDAEATLRVVQQDQCRTDCPACSRVCPVGAIMFPKYQTNQAIAGAIGGERGEIKLDLSKIFGKPKGRHQAALERDRELVKAGRRPVGADKVEQLADAFEKLEI
ncbi:MAG TPA: ferredoxin family protein [Planctomycetota bacterium]|nr:ferredoxin family protein [Planctomycetota bacterium]